MVQLLIQPIGCFLIRVKWVPFLYDTVRTHDAEGEGLHIWTVGMNIFNKQSQTSDKGRSTSLAVVLGLTTPPKGQHLTKCYTGSRNWIHSLERT
jgi:hypothetical protein